MYGFFGRSWPAGSNSGKQREHQVVVVSVLEVVHPRLRRGGLLMAELIKPVTSILAAVMGPHQAIRLGATHLPWLIGGVCGNAHMGTSKQGLSI